MKQHITTDQLNELSQGQKDRLRKWWFGANKVYTKNTLLSIGQMIEYLNETKPDIHIETYHDEMWGVSTCYDIDKTEPQWRFKKQYENELCDALWKTVKEEL